MSLKVTEDLYNFVTNEAERLGVPMNALIIFALNDYRERKENVKEQKEND